MFRFCKRAENYERTPCGVWNGDNSCKVKLYDRLCFDFPLSTLLPHQALISIPKENSSRFSTLISLMCSTILTPNAFKAIFFSLKQQKRVVVETS
ncbi:CLUMA_CG002889, isoform A [Clunio marinus]|uniref:CLUMA_CG002889, isoform A n=1 Tax=Clunio marinus TaxID=568069 RepID=A0A1J1HLJ2_9DIPT|nr:CLUMA_CG002889, isoform A [Clunio marinus]